MQNQGKSIDRRTIDPAIGLRVLLVEDDEVNQRLVAKVLVESDHRVTLARNGLEALRAYDTHGFDVILTDIRMPWVGGLDLARAIRARERGGSRRTRIVAHTASTASSDRERCFQAGMDGFIGKPVVPRELLEVVSCSSEWPISGRWPVMGEAPVSGTRAIATDERAEDDARVGAHKVLQIAARIEGATKEGDLAASTELCELLVVASCELAIVLDGLRDRT